MCCIAAEKVSPLGECKEWLQSHPEVLEGCYYQNHSRNNWVCQVSGCFAFQTFPLDTVMYDSWAVLHGVWGFFFFFTDPQGRPEHWSRWAAKCMTESRSDVQWWWYRACGAYCNVTSWFCLCHMILFILNHWWLLKTWGWESPQSDNIITFELQCNIITIIL